MDERFLIREAQPGDLEAINAIYNREVLEGVATWDEQPWGVEARAAWFAERTRGGDAVLEIGRAHV